MDKGAVANQRKRQRNRSQLEAILIRTAERPCIRSKVSPSDSGVSVKGFKKTRSCDIELGSRTESIDQFDDAIRATLGKNGTVHCVDPKANVEQHDLDELTKVSRRSTQQRRQIWSEVSGKGLCVKGNV